MKLDNDQMGATERVWTAVNLEEPDRVPIYLMGMPAYADFYQEFLRREEDDALGFSEFTEVPGNLKFTPLGDLTVPYFFGQEVAHCRVDVEGRFTKPVDEEGRVVEDGKPPALAGEEGLQVTYYGRLEGVKRLPNGHLYTWYVDGFLKTKQAVIDWFDRWGWPHEKPVSRLDLKAAAEFRSRFGDDFALVHSIGGAGLYEKAWFMMGQARFLYYARKDPEFVERVVDSLKQMQLNVVDELKRDEPKIFWCADDMGQKGRSLLSPALYRKFISPARREVFEAIHEEAGAKVVMHSCGNVVELLPLLVEDGLDGWQSMEPAAEIDHAAVKKKFGDRLSLWGGIDSSRVMCFGATADVREHVRRQLGALAPGGGYVAGPAHDYLNVRVDNALAARDAILEFGRY